MIYDRGLRIGSGSSACRTFLALFALPSIELFDSANVCTYDCLGVVVVAVAALQMAAVVCVVSLWCCIVLVSYVS